MVKTMCDGEMIEHFMQFVSLDAWGQKAEYIRNGMDFGTVWYNVNRFLSEIKGHNSLTFIITMNNLSVTSLQTLMENILKLREKYSSTYQRVWFDTPILRHPDWQQIALLDNSFDRYFEDAILYMKQHQHSTDMVAFRDYEIAKVERCFAIMKQGVEDKHKHMANFWRFFITHDARRNTSLLDTFPEYSEWFKQCQKANNE